MATYAQIIEDLANLVHESWIAGQRAKGRTSAKSRHEDGSPDLMVPYADLAEVDKDDDRRIVCAVLLGLANRPVAQLLGVMHDLRTNGDLRARLRELALVDPAPDRLVDRCADLATGEDSQR